MRINQVKSPDIELIIHRCEILNANEKLEVHDFGQKLILHYTFKKTQITVEKLMNSIW